MWNFVFNKVFGFVGEWVDHKIKIKEAKQQTELTIELKKQEVLTQQATADINWDLIQAKSSDGSWKDEYWTIVLSVPAIFGFFPGLQGEILEGFRVLEQMPDWYIFALLTSVAAAFGRSELIKWAREVKK